MDFPIAEQLHLAHDPLASEAFSPTRRGNRDQVVEKLEAPVARSSVVARLIRRVALPLWCMGPPSRIRSGCRVM
ncbi:MAG: hypothetical protein P8127_11750, partial [Acidobacteriota bacterium]